MNTRDLGTLLHYALRYACGRHTYIVEDVQRILRENFDSCTYHERRNLRMGLEQELALAGQRGNWLGSEPDHRAWTALWAWMRDREARTPATKETP